MITSLFWTNYFDNKSGFIRSGIYAYMCLYKHCLIYIPVTCKYQSFLPFIVSLNIDLKIYNLLFCFSIRYCPLIHAYIRTVDPLFVEYATAQVGVSLAGKCAITHAFSVVFLLTAEVFPTTFRYHWIFSNLFNLILILYNK